MEAAHELGYSVWVLDPDPGSPAGRIADKHLVAGYDDDAALTALAAGCAAITTEFENVPAPTLERLARSVRVRPSAAAVATCQDRIAEKSFLRDQRLPHGLFAIIRTEADLASAPAALFPGVLKVARLGYDGKGQVRMRRRWKRVRPGALQTMRPACSKRCGHSTAKFPSCSPGRRGRSPHDFRLRRTATGTASSMCPLPPPW